MILFVPSECYLQREMWGSGGCVPQAWKGQAVSPRSHRPPGAQPLQPGQQLQCSEWDFYNQDKTFMEHLFLEIGLPFSLFCQLKAVSR